MAGCSVVLNIYLRSRLLTVDSFRFVNPPLLICETLVASVTDDSNNRKYNARLTV